MQTDIRKQYKFMKQTILTYLFLCLGLTAFGQGTVNVELLNFKEENGSLNASYNAQISNRAIETSQSLRFYPMLQAGDSVLILPGATIIGKNKKKVLSRFDKVNKISFIPARHKDNTVLKFDVKAPYAAWMDSASLILKQELTGYRNKSTLTTYKLIDKVELSPRVAYAVNPAIAFILPQKEEKHRKRQGKAYLDFQVGRSVIIPSYRRNPEELAKINEAVRYVISNPAATIQGLYIEGYASPEGPYTTNERLSQERAQALKEYIQKKFNLNSNLFRVSSVAEDWDGLTELIKAGTISQKDRILDIIANVSIFDGRETQLMRLDGGAPFRLMAKEMFPELRRVEYQIDYTVKDYNTKQALAVLDKNPGDLSQLELYNLALTYGKDTKEYNRILLEVIPKYFPDDETANCNAAAILIKNGELTSAKRYLEKAGNNGATQNNLGLVYLLDGDFDMAKACFAKAQKLGCDEAEANLQELQTKKKDNERMKRYQNKK